MYDFDGRSVFFSNYTIQYSLLLFTAYKDIIFIRINWIET